MMKTLVHCRAGRAIGFGLFFLGALLYRSDNRDVLGWWSWSYVAVVVSSGAIFVLALVRSWRLSRPSLSCGTGSSRHSGLFDIGYLLWGGGYLLRALDPPDGWGEIAELNAFGSSNPAAALLFWGALVLACLSLARTVVPRGRASTWGAILLASWVSAVVLLLVEGGLRVSTFLAPQPPGYPTYATSIWYRQFVSLNRGGYRDVDHAIAAPNSRRRVLVVGDSLAFGFGVDRMEERFGEQLAGLLTARTGGEWETINASKNNTHTLTHIEFVEAMQGYQPDVVLLLYAFNDIDYLAQVTPTGGPKERPTSVLERLSLGRFLYNNSFLYQEVYVRLWMWRYRIPSGEKNPYDDDALLTAHFHDLSRFTNLAAASGAVVAIVPFDIKVTANSAVNRRYDHFVKAAAAYGLPVWSAGVEVFAGHSYKELAINKLDSHPNALAHRLLANRVADHVRTVMGRQLEARSSERRAQTL